ncbi:VWA domain-containing protein [Catellatospora tritici]|uniref:VWA domain-containing protein n=1 Tax=Catellatospora tritici TaxID=2851566 RepID=UPI001C2D16FE|nr:type II secretion system F family protein [Catellatospora tritici]MBV1852172.1 type II secretion system F family protein [Catellatospora tritici]
MRPRILAGVLTAMLLALAPGQVAAAAAPTLTVSGLRQEPGLIEFYLSARDLPGGSRLDQVGVAADAQVLVTEVEPVSAVKSASVPRRAVFLVLDTSGSMAGAPIQAARVAAARYLAQMPGDVQVGLVSAGAPATVVLRPTGDRAAATRALADLTAKGGTALYDGIKLATAALSGGDWAQRRIVALSDGADTASKATAAAVESAAIAAAVAVDTIAFRTADASVGQLAQLSSGTHGTAYTAADAAALAEAFATASGSLTVQLLVRVNVPPSMAGRQVRLTITAAGVSTEVPLSLAVDTAVSEPLTGAPANPPSNTLLLVSMALVFLALLGGALLLISPAYSAADRRRRLAQVEQFVAAPRRSAQPAPENSSQVTAAALALSAQVVRSANVESRLAQQLDRAGMRLRPHEWLLIRALVCLGAAALLAMTLGVVGGVVLGPLLGWALTALVHRNRASKRTRAFREALPDALQLVVGSLRSGFSLAQALDAMAREMPDPLSTEFGRALGEHRLGVDLEDAVERVATRMQSKELAWVVVAIRVQREVGGNLAEVLATTIETIRERETLHREVRSLSAEGRISAWVLLALPVVVGALMFAIRSEYIETLFTTAIGLLMSGIAVTLVAVGGFWLSRLTKIEV